MIDNSPQPNENIDDIDPTVSSQNLPRPLDGLESALTESFRAGATHIITIPIQTAVLAYKSIQAKLGSERS